VADALRALAARPDLAGIFHWAGAAAVSRWELGRAIAAQLGVTADRLAPMTRADTPAVAATRPRDLALDLAPLDRDLGLQPETLADAVRTLRRPVWFQPAG
jgi:dTDP-4-dehydrorhamnose reductase